MNEKFVKYIYSCICRYDKRIFCIDKDDVLQEIRYACLVSNKDDVFRTARNAVERLLCDYGYSRKKGKDNFEPYYEILGMQQEYFCDEEEKIKLLSLLEQLYIVENKTVREIAEIFGVEYNIKLQKIFGKVFPKGFGRGGARKNAGRKKKIDN